MYPRIPDPQPLLSSGSWQRKCGRIMSGVDADLDVVLIGGPERRPIEIADYDPAWPSRFDYHAGRVRNALGSGTCVEHIGSTSVPGLAAKAVIDMLLIVRDIDDESDYLPALVQAGMVLRVREDGHRMFRTRERDVHLHVYSDGAPEIQDYRDLRDWLAHDATDRALYASTKRSLADRQWADANYYAQAKDEVIALILDHARHWRSL